MPNDFFQFKQFNVEQGGAAMKVCTDSCVLGAWASYHQPKYILDIGTGTGLLALMLAQKYPNAHIDAIEIDREAAIQAEFNFNQSHWKEDIKLIVADYSNWEANLKYDLIISNPPFFLKNLKSPDSKINLAHHADNESLKSLSKYIARNLNDSGKACIMYPPFESALFEKEMLKQGLYQNERVILYRDEKRKPFRHLVQFSHQKADLKESELLVKQQSQYSPEFVELLKEYYNIF